MGELIMWDRSWRDVMWGQLDQQWDIIIVGGGITGAGILSEANQLGLRCLLVEQRDFAWGASSRSSKMVHGGLRYLKGGDVQLTRLSVREREALLRERAGLIRPLGFLLPTYRARPLDAYVYALGLHIYDLLSQHKQHHQYQSQEFRLLAPHLVSKGLTGGFHYEDAQTDDARLVLQIIREAVSDGGVALNYARVDDLLWQQDRVTGVRLRDELTQRTAELSAGVVMNATGAWADGLRGRMGAGARMRPLRGSHLVFPAWRFPIAQAVSVPHPRDGHPVFACPWEGVTLVGTTDRDHHQDLEHEPRIQPEEVGYLMEAVDTFFPDLNVTSQDITATFSGIRPVVARGKTDPAREKRDHVIWEEKGLVTVTGGKLTIFRAIAREALAAISQAHAQTPNTERKQRVSMQVNLQDSAMSQLGGAARERLLGRYGREASTLLAIAQAGEAETIPGTQILWAELRWAARAEGVMHLEDLLLRRVRLGLVAPHGGRVHLPAIRAICQPELGWDDARWEQEEQAYLAVWRHCYSPPA